ncbi:hypothetical protein [Neoaquamicrobium sediminum]|uniref:hypothetical protein n=1 Tax=Neoaquamicrobium sediminum TaxID=1849104 RepID=UPI0015635506|nr:hypothetical protein [Mesorhizobium sediminum]NRC55172.1 hypothetical protein [Mesorhizobium sediminum]
MNIQEAQAAVEAAETALEAARAEFGEALASGSASDALRKKVTKAEAAAEDAQMALKAIEAAEMRAARAAQDRAEREAQDRLRQLHSDFQKDHAEWVNVAGEIDELTARLVDAFTRFEGQGSDLVERYRELNLNSNIASVAKNAPGLYAQWVCNLRNHGSPKMRSWLYRVLKPEATSNSTGHMKTFAQMTPAVSAFFTGKEPKRRAA